MNASPILRIIILLKVPILLFILCVLTFAGCTPSSGTTSESSTLDSTLPIVDFVSESNESQTSESNSADSEDTNDELLLPPVNLICAEGFTLEDRIEVPEGYERTPAEEGSFAAFIRNYEMKPDKSPVLLYDGTEKNNQNDHVAVFSMNMVSGDLQQCADSIMRVYAEYFYATNQKDRIQFHFVNGFLCDYNTYSTGGRVQVSGNSVSWVTTATAADSFTTLEQYLKTVFMYASTLSMEQESSETTLEQLQVGDVFIYGGSPGHVVMVADLCKSGDNTAFLLAQGYMPAQEFHILKNPSQDDGNPWYYANEISYPFVTPEYTFNEGSLKHMNW